MLFRSVSQSRYGVDSGSFTEGNATGSLLVKFTDDTKLNTTATGAVTLIRPSGSTGSPTSYANAINVTEVQVTDSWGAGIYYANYDDEVLSSNSSKTAAYLSTNRRWYPLDMGWEATFKTDSTCTATGIPTIRIICVDIIIGMKGLPDSMFAIHFNTA